MEIRTKYGMGDELKEAVTGIKGIVMGITLYSTGCIHYGLLDRKLTKNGDIKDWIWFDESRLSPTGKHIDVMSTKPTSGPANRFSPNAPEV